MPVGLFDLSGKVALIPGGYGGIGAALRSKIGGGFDALIVCHGAPSRRGLEVA
jgi:NAD(P)-dependent dehydrogenase (short-subunit alcohol dehydrogenase family)